MKTKISGILIPLFLFPLLLSGAAVKSYDVLSPAGKISLHVEAGPKMMWSLSLKGKAVVLPSSISMQLADGTFLGEGARILAATKKAVNTQFNAINYTKAAVKDEYNQLTLRCQGDYSVEFRVYDNAVAYRFITARKGELVVKNEEVNVNFTADHTVFVPIQWDYRDGQNFNTSFEALYREIPLSRFPKDSLAFLPILADAGDCRILLLEADLEDYPGMYMDLNGTGKGFKGVWAPYPLEAHRVARNFVPVKRADYIAKTTGTRSFPWRVAVVAEADKDLLSCDIVQQLAAPNRLADISWIKPGQVAWDWWNDWNISHVDFRSGINTETYKYYIDFAAANNLSYIIVDEGWTTEQDLTVTKPGFDLKSIVEYGKQKNIGVILWTTWYAALNQMDIAFPFFEKTGVNGLKIDFLDRDDQVAVASTYAIARKAAEHHLLVDYHGIYKPTGLQRTYPNVVGYEGVKGMENVKWADENVPRYDVTLPFIRNVAGPMDYTPGAMRNASMSVFRPINSMPMSKGTRCHQMAMYVVFNVPLQMLSDNPTVYRKEQECTDFITAIPTTFDETIPIEGKAGRYVALARRKGDTWYVGAMTDWSSRELTLDFSFLGTGTYKATVFSDGINADRDATDYKKEETEIKAGDRVGIRMMDGGGWAAILTKK
jgi:alpha-glucosidase